MKKLSVALVTGGDVAERGISLLSAETVKHYLDPNKYSARIIDFQKGDFTDVESGVKLNKSDFTLPLDDLVHFDLVYPILHGSPAEDGILQGYLNLLGIPFTGCDTLASALSFNKQACKTFLMHYDIPQAKSILIKKDGQIDQDVIADLNFPLFVKPNQNGSSYGISRVNEATEILAAIEKAFQFDDEVLVETFLDGPEFSNGAYRKGDEIIVLPITEIIPDEDVAFFDYKAKYENKSQEVTPARIPEALTESCKSLTKKIYEVLNCRGICRVDYILMGGEFYFLEINTIPGFSPNSLVPQQAEAMDIPINVMLEAVINEALN